MDSRQLLSGVSGNPAHFPKKGKAQPNAGANGTAWLVSNLRQIMKREKRYKGGHVSVHGWRLLAKLAEKTIGSTCISATSTVWKDGGEWGFERLEDCLADINPTRSDLFMHFPEKKTIRLYTYDVFGWSIDGASKTEILSFEREAEEIIQAHWIAAPPLPKIDHVIFIGHGRSADWRELKDHLSDKHDIQVEVYETGSRSGHSIRDVLEDMLQKSSLAILVHTPEDEMMDGSFNSRPNVIHETGLFQGRLGFSRAIVLLKEDTKEFSNLSGIQQIRYSDIRQTYGEVLAWIKREENA
jgi:Predicted nucleotide-binding protein containing TIR-like domain